MKTFDLIVYGATPGGVVCAYEAARQGLSVAIVGGWRERHLGGMMSGGLGGTDLHTREGLCGLAFEVLAWIAKAGGHREGRKNFEPRFAEQVFDTMLEAAGVPVFWSRGVESVSRRGTRLTEFSTVDGQSFAATVFADCSYEGDLMARAGVGYIVGREARNPGNRLNGFRGRSTRALGAAHNWIRWGADVDPYRSPGDLASGTVAGITPHPRLHIGAADHRVQAYCFRLIMTDDPARRVHLPASPPAAFDPADYELLFRHLAAMTAHGQRYGEDYLLKTRLLLMKRLAPGVFDVNNRGPFSLDLIGGSHHYPDADYAEREIIWKRHERHIRGLFYALQHHQDDRVPPPLREAVRALGWDRRHFTGPHPDDEPHWPYQLYVRESRRMVGDFVLAAADLPLVRGRGVRPIASGAYRKDSHHCQRFVIRDGDRSRLWNEGNFEKRLPGGGFSVPWDVVTPRRSEASNLLVGFCVSATHEAFGAVRMETTLMGIGQAIGMAAAIMLETKLEAVQDVPYPVLRSRIEGAPDKVPFRPAVAKVAA